MSETAEPVSERAALAVGLRRLRNALSQQENLSRQQRELPDVLKEANKRRRGKGVKALSRTAVYDWFPRRRTGSEEPPSVPRDFEDLWAVVAVMLYRTGELTGGREAGLRLSWKNLYEEALHGTSVDEEVRAYLEAAGRFADHHPYPGVSGRAVPPYLSRVYVRQRSSLAAEGEPGLAAAAEPAEAVFGTASRVCVLIAAPGGGKSTLLRSWLGETARGWLGTAGAARTPRAVPVLVSARSLAEENVPVPDALAAATGNLSDFGRDPGLNRACFLRRPCTGAHWQLLVDGLDELPDARERRAVLEKLASAVAGDPLLYRCVVATRPLAGNELDALDTALGSPAPRYYLQPFTASDQLAYTGKYFAGQWPQEEAARRALQFTEALRNASLAELARTPLMAFMLCQLHLASPQQPLLSGRTAVYKAFTDLAYHKNDSKQVFDSHEKAVRRLVQTLQTPQARKEARNAARQALDQLPGLIDRLACQWLVGYQGTAAETLASQHAVRRPGKVDPQAWDAFLDDLLGLTGLLVHHADGPGFLHQTFLEYHAACHATRDRQARRETLRQLFGSVGWVPSYQSQVPCYLPRGWQSQDPSYLGFLIDRLLDPDDNISDNETRAETRVRLEELPTLGIHEACRVILKQVQLRTNLPAQSTAQHLTSYALDPTLSPYYQAEAAEAAERLARVDGHRDEGMIDPKDRLL